MKGASRSWLADVKSVHKVVYDSRHTPDYILRRMAAHGYTQEDFVESVESVRSGASADS